MHLASRGQLAGILLFALALYALQHYVAALEYDRQQILFGQVWRLWTGHFVHSHLTHMALNGVSAVAMYSLFMTRIKPLELVICGAVFPLLISVALLMFYPGLEWYNGLSGLLHAYAGYVCMRFASSQSKLYWLGLAMLWAKVLSEAWRASAGYQGELAGMTIVTQAHLVGAALGTLSGVVCLLALRTVGTSTAADLDARQSPALGKSDR